MQLHKELINLIQDYVMVSVDGVRRVKNMAMQQLIAMKHVTDISFLSNEMSSYYDMSNECPPKFAPSSIKKYMQHWHLYTLERNMKRERQRLLNLGVFCPSLVEC